MSLTAPDQIQLDLDAEFGAGFDRDRGHERKGA